MAERLCLTISDMHNRIEIEKTRPWMILFDEVGFDDSDFILGVWGIFRL